jgi:hypothetical protein
MSAKSREKHSIYVRKSKLLYLNHLTDHKTFRFSPVSMSVLLKYNELNLKFNLKKAIFYSDPKDVSRGTVDNGLNLSSFRIDTSNQD